MPTIGSATKIELNPPSRSPVDVAEFKGAMAGLAATVQVVTASFAGERTGRTVTSVLSLSATPPTILVSIYSESHLAECIAKANAFSLSMLTEKQVDVADAFAGHIAPELRFTVGNWTEWPSGNPRLRQARASLDCEVIGTMQAGTHLLFVGAIVATETSETLAPLTWHSRSYHGLRRI